MPERDTAVTMQSLATALLAVLAAIAAGRGLSRTSVDAQLREHPIKGVITMLEELQKTAADEGKAEAADYAAYADWCAKSKGTLNSAISDEKTKIDELETEIEGLKATIAATEEDIGYLETQIEEQKNAAAAAKKARDDRHKLYEKEQDNYDETIDAVDTAVKALEESESMNLLQAGSAGPLATKLKKAAILGAVHMSKDARHKVKGFLKSAAGEEPVSTFHSGAIEEEFKHMEEDFKADKGASVEDETHAKNEYNLAKQSRDEAIDQAQTVLASKRDFLADSESDKANAEKDLKEQQDFLVADTATLDSTTKDCATTAQQMKERSATRANELESMKKAVEILEKVTKVRNPDTHEIPAKLVQIKKGFDYGMADDAVGFLQRASRHHKHHKGRPGKDKQHALREEAVQLLKKAASESQAVHKVALGQLASQLLTYDGPFDQLKAMIQKMVFHLMKEQTDEDEHKNWCDVEVETNTELKDDRDEKLREFTKKIEKMDAEINELTKNLAANNEKIEQITTSMKEETEIRAANHKEIVATIKDASEASAAIAKATEVLTQFYKESGMIPKEPWEFVQVSARRARDVELPDSPATWDASYTGVTDPENGDNAVLELLGRVGEKFATMEAEAKVQDESDQKMFDQDMQAKTIEKKETEMDTAMKEERKVSLEEKNAGMAQAKKHTSREMDHVTAYLKDLEPACSEGDSTYDDRKKARKDEIEALRKAQTVLEDAFREQDKK